MNISFVLSKATCTFVDNVANRATEHISSLSAVCYGDMSFDSRHTVMGKVTFSAVEKLTIFPGKSMFALPVLS